jgi:hypothetical protein
MNSTVKKMNTYSTHLETLAAQLQGRLIRPGDADYDPARAVWNGMIDRYPAVIVRCTTVADVIAAVNFAREHSICVSVRGGGHNVAGSAVIDDGLVIDLSDMKHIHVDPQARTASAEGGVIWGELDRATQQYGLATPGGVVSDTGIAGLTLGGGLGWLRRKCGLSCDNLISAQVITSDGRLLTASENQNADLLWALRGGGSLGVVTSFEYRLHPVGPEVMMAFVFHDGKNTRELLRFYRQYTASAPDEVSSFAILGKIPSTAHFPPDIHGRSFVLFFACYAGPVDDGARIMQPLRDYATPLHDLSGVMPFVQAQTLFDEDYPAGELRYYWRSSYLNGLSDEAIDRLALLAQAAPSPLNTLDIWHLGGAIGRVAPEATAFAHRSAPYMLGIEANWAAPADDTANITWAKRVSHDMRPFSDGAQYLNFPGFWENGEAQLRAIYGVNYERIMSVRAKYDPAGMFSIRV